MKDLRSVRRLIKMRLRRGRAFGARLAPGAGEGNGASAATRSAHTPSGLAVEEQVRKAWAPSGGLPTF